jgi:hypothetical protein
MTVAGAVRFVACGLLSVGLSLVGMDAAAQASLSPEEVKELISSRFNVEVLRVTAIEGEGGEPAYRVVVMVPPANSNEAFRVSMLIVDARSGQLVPQFRHRREGYDLPSSRAAARENSGPVSRRETFRTPF